MKRSAYLRIAFIGLFAFLVSCGGGGGSVTVSTGSVTFFVTDDISNFEHVDSTVNKVQFVQTGSGASCDVLTTPAAMDLTDLASFFELLNSTSCAAQPYNRIHIEFARTVSVTDNTGFTNKACAFTSYKDNNNKSNVLDCSGDICSLDITGAVNILADKTNDVALDFDLKNFDVADLAGPDCSVTMKVSPLTASDMNGKMMQGYRAGVTGTISGLDTTAKIFTITRGNMTFTVNYAGVTQQGIDDILQLAQTDGLKVNVRASTTDLSDTIIAAAIYVKAEGAVSGLDTTSHTFNLTYTPAGGSAKTIAVDYTDVANPTEAATALSSSDRVDVALSGFNGSFYLAHEVKVE